MKTALAVRQVAYQGLGSLVAPLAAAGYRIFYVEAASGGLDRLDPLGPDLLIVLGGPFGVNEIAGRPCVVHALDLVRARLEVGKPILGICLGAQMIAKACGAEVVPMGVQEIGWKKLELNEEGFKGPLRHLCDMPLLHWHGETFQLPSGAAGLAATDLCRHQAFSIGPQVLALQFHLEVDPRRGLREWIDGHASYLRRYAVDVPGLLEATRAAARSDRGPVTTMFVSWLRAMEA